MSLKYFFSGFFVKAITGFDDTMVHVPIVANITKTKKGRIAFCLGIFLAVCLAITISFFFASAIKLIPYHKYLAAGLIFLIAMSIYFEWFIEEPKKRIKSRFKKIKTISAMRFFKLLGIGLITAIVTVIDDSIAYSAVFLSGATNPIYPIAGILTMTLIELVVIVKFSKQVSKIKYKKEITTIGLIILSGLLLLGIL